MANLINTFNPQKVVLGDYVTQAYGFLLRVIQKTVQERALRWPREAADIVVALYNRLHPDLILSGHWQPLRVTPKSLPKIASDAEALDRLHREILPEAPDLGAEGFLARISLSQVTTLAGETVPFEVEIRNLFSHAQEAAIHVVVPQGWEVQPIERTLEITGIHHLSFQVTPPQGLAIRRDRIAVDLTVAGPRFGQQTEALVTVLS